MEAVPVARPTSMAEVEVLVKRLYEPGNPSTIASIEQQLQQLQKSPEGWQLADALLASSDANVRFFGALTFTVKLTSDPQSLDEEAANELLTVLINWLVRLISLGEKDLVTRKLCTTLVQYFLSNRAPWDHSVRHLICSFARGEAVRMTELDQYPATDQLVAGLSVAQILAVLWFSESLIQEAKRTTYGADVLAKTEGRIEQNCEDMIPVIHRAISYAGISAERMHETGISCMATWAFFVTRTKSSSEEVIRRKKQVQTLIAPAVHCVYADPEYSVEGLADMLRKRGSHFFEEEHIDLIHELITSPWGQQQLVEMFENDTEAESFVGLLLAFTAAVMDEILADPDAWQQILVIMHQMLKCPGYAVEDENTSLQALEFWGNFASEIADPLDPEFITSPTLNAHLLQAAEEFWIKACAPPQQTLNRWDKETIKGFRSFRTDISDFLCDAFHACGGTIVSGFVGLALSNIQHQDWIKVEASLFSLNAITKAGGNFAEQRAYDEILAGLLGSPLLTTDVFQPQVPRQTKITAVELLGRYSSFFIRHEEYLVAPLNTLFNALTVPETSLKASRAIHSLCISCRDTLAPELDNFLVAYKKFLASPTANRQTKEKIIGGIAALLQGITLDEVKCRYLGTLVQHIEEDVRSSLEYMSRNEVEKAEDACCTALLCIAAVDKSLQCQHKKERRVVIDLESDSTDTSFWKPQQAGIELQARVVKCIQMMIHVFIEFGEVNEAICGVFRWGFANRIPGPFDFPPSVFLNFVLRTTVDTPRVTFILLTICTFLNAHSSRIKDAMSEHPVTQVAVQLVGHVVGFIQKLGEPATEPDVAADCVEVLQQTIRHSPMLLLSRGSQDVESALMFTIHCIQGPDVLPKRAGCHLWTALITVSNEAESISKQSLNQVIEHLGPLFVKALVFNIAGNAQRTSLDDIIDPLRRIVTKHPRSGTWIETALLSPDFPAPKVVEKDRLWFKRMVLAARGGVNTKTTANNFWQKCRDAQR